MSLHVITHIGPEQYRTLHEDPCGKMTPLFFDGELSVSNFHHVPTLLIYPLIRRQVHVGKKEMRTCHFARRNPQSSSALRSS